MTTATILNQPHASLHDPHTLPMTESRWHMPDSDFRSQTNLPGPPVDGPGPINSIGNVFRTRGNAIANSYTGIKETPRDVTNAMHPEGLLPLFGRAPYTVLRPDSLDAASFKPPRRVVTYAELYGSTTPQAFNNKNGPQAQKFGGSPYNQSSASSPASYWNHGVKDTGRNSTDFGPLDMSGGKQWTQGYPWGVHDRLYKERIYPNTQFYRPTGQKDDMKPGQTGHNFGFSKGMYMTPRMENEHYGRRRIFRPNKEADSRKQLYYDNYRRDVNVDELSSRAPLGSVKIPFNTFTSEYHRQPMPSRGEVKNKLAARSFTVLPHKNHLSNLGLNGGRTEQDFLNVAYGCKGTGPYQ